MEKTCGKIGFVVLGALAVAFHIFRLRHRKSAFTAAKPLVVHLLRPMSEEELSFLRARLGQNVVLFLFLFGSHHPQVNRLIPNSRFVLLRPHLGRTL